MSTLKNEVDPQRLKMNVIEYFNGFSKDVQDIIDKFKLRQQVDNLTEVGRLGSLLEKFTDGNINLCQPYDGRGYWWKRKRKDGGAIARTR